MKYTGVDGESQDGNHNQWSDLNGAGSPHGEGPAHESSESAAPPDSINKGASVNVPTIVLTGLMLLALATVAVLANINKGGDSAQEPEEIVFEPEEVLLDEGSATLNASYSTADFEFFHADGEDDIGLSIVKNKDKPDLYDIAGTLNSTQKVGIDGMDQGQICTVEILHEVKYTVQGTFSSVGCKFEISVTMTPISSQLLAQGCTVDINLDPSAMHIAPRPEKMVFTKSFESISSEAFSFYFHDVALPSGVNCPAFSNQ